MDQFNFSSFPETNFNEVNLSWMLEVMTQFKEDIESGKFVGPQGPPGPQGDPGPAGDGITEEVKQALLQLARKVAYVDAGGQTYYQDLYNALYGVTPAELASISAAYTQTGTVYDTDSLDSLKSDLVVTATYSDSSTAVIPAADYTLSGSLTIGTSTITVSYQGKTATFQVTVTESSVTLVSISAAFNQGSATIYDTDSLDTLKQYLIVTATYSDSSTATVPSADYTLSGTLTAGTSTVTVSYGGKTTTFNVTVSGQQEYLYNWDLTQSLADTVHGATLVLSDSGASQDSTGLHITSATGCAKFPFNNTFGYTYEIDVLAVDRQGVQHGRFITFRNSSSGTYDSGFIYRSTGKWAIYGLWVDSAVTSPTAFDGKTLKLEISNSGAWTVSCDGEVVVTASSINGQTTNYPLSIGSENAQGLYNVTITGIRVY